MNQDPNQLNELSERLHRLVRKQDQLQVEAQRLRREIEQLKRQAYQPTQPAEDPTIDTTAQPVPVADPGSPISSSGRRPIWQQWSDSINSSDWEKFIGENLVSKIGILITVIGVAFGAKYAIDNELISPLTRIVLGYLAGIGLLATAIRLKEKYENFSAVLLSGALAILYIITYFGFAYFDLFPQLLAFSLMVLFTAFAVLAAWHYDRQIIALIGLVGAYGVPFLLSEDTGNVSVLFGYMAVINIGILVIAFRKSWKVLYHAAFWLTWLIYSWWALDGYQRQEDFAFGLSFLLVFYLLFYATFLAYKIPAREPFSRWDVILLLTNSFIFFGFGYMLLEDRSGGEVYLGIFAVVNAVIHFLAGKLIQRAELADRSLFYFVVGLVLVFLTLAIPIQLDGNWVTLLWIGEAALLFWLGRSRQVPAFERMVLPLLILAIGSLLEDWSSSYYLSTYTPEEQHLQPIWNIQLLTTLLVAGALGFMVWLQQKGAKTSPLPEGNLWRQALRYLLPGGLLLVLYFGFRAEIDYYWQLRIVQQPAFEEFSQAGLNLQRLSNISQVYYTLLFLLALSWINMRWIKTQVLAWINLGFNVLGILAFLVVALYEISWLQVSYAIDDNTVQTIGAYTHTYLRYVGYGLVAALLYTTYRYQQQAFSSIKNTWPFDALLHLTILWCSSSELVYWLHLQETVDSYKLGLSILWGVYALFLIGLGIAQRKAYLRVAAIVLFAITLIKLFFYDIAHLNTISKTVVLLALGGLLLIISFLYNKFRGVIGETPTTVESSVKGEGETNQEKE